MGFVTEEQKDGTHRVIKGRVGKYCRGSVIPADVVQKMIGGEPVDMGNGYTMAGRDRDGKGS
ncbi:hypothetical protein [Azospirillum canadense]|uniref:hypothetical protein n=1 Tax=Azospirillum canadense TaxID=403962 RepID=UPI002227A5D7|nr:hypothetical protein [Azospirillum canadense]MCW2242240.1 hypothetical protein [Azospirillum canadense]